MKNCKDLTTRMPIGVGKLRDGVYFYHSMTTATASHVKKEDYMMWHRRMGHPSTQISWPFPVVKNDNSDLKSVCEICLQAKQTKDVFPISINKAVDSFDLIHSDVWGPYKIASHCGAHYFLTIVDDCSRAVWVFLMAEKKEATTLLISFCAMVKNQFGKSVKCIRTDNGLEFANKRVMEFCADNGILHQKSCVHTPQQNGRVERKHRHILNVARALRFQAHLPLEFWGECILAAVYLINRTPTRLLANKTPYELLFGKTPTYNAIKTFGCLCYISCKHPGLDKFEKRSQKCVFVGYPYGKKGWKVYDLNTRKILVSRDVVFDEMVFPFAELMAAPSPQYDENRMRHSDIFGEDPPAHVVEATLSRGSADCDSDLILPESSLEQTATAEQLFDDVGNDTARNNDTQRPVVVHEQRVRRAPVRLADYICYTARVDGETDVTWSTKSKYPISHYVTCDKFSSAHRVFLNAVTKEKEPAHFGEAIKCDKWREAMRDEIDALERNRTWTMENLPPGKTAIGCKWVYRVKYHADGRVERYKARLVALGNRQIQGVDYAETFAPVAKMVSVRTFLAVAAIKGWALHQMDVHNAFLHGDLHEEVYMRLPPGFSSSMSGKVCRLRKSIYGLRQAPRMWFYKLTSTLETYGFVQSKADYSLFTYRKGKAFLAILIYVDDLVIAGNDSEVICDFKKYMSTMFHMKDLGTLKYFLGIEIARGTDGVFLSQRKYALDLLAECGLLAAKPSCTPIEQNHRLAECQSEKLKDPETYRRLIGKLIYLTITRPELSFSVHTLAQFMGEPLEAHYEAALRVMRYLKSNPGQGILLRAESELQLNAYCDSDWASCPITRRSVTGYFVMIGCSPVSWKTKKQPTVSRSSAEAEYRSMASVTCELIWLKSFLSSLDIDHVKPMKLHCDSQAAIHIATNPVFHERTKHIELDCHFVRDQIKLGSVVAQHTRSSEQRADLFTKALGKKQFYYLLNKLGISNLHAPT
ncbi:Retroelement pol polyprotein-like [Rhynchospora pubera]|uniref:Retroelement pol polyprotein-like n=1 Tax=Rhynchospora pubera TaxID=906938 RepID=A0AAV8CGT5_9POAL|nr:Retroelement pol polyprotein-like [Rhynchospora pubera]